MTRIGFVAVFLASFIVATIARAQNSQTVSADDTARFLAGMQPSANSPLVQLTQDAAAKQHATYFDTAFGNLDKNQLAKIRAWSAANLNAPKPVMFYMFGGPDFLYANALFPNATTYVLSGLEPVGQIPDLMKLPRWSTLQGLRNIQGSLRSVLTVSYFITVQMYQDLNAGPVNGTLPILYVFLARSGKTIHDVSLVHLDEQGVLQPGEGSRPLSPARGVKIVFSENDGPQKTLYYFSTNLADVRGKNNALLQFCKSLGQGDSFVKSASYLLHNSSFSQVRNFILDNSASVLQDDTGVPVTQFDTAKWQLRAFGRYVTPIFPSYYQPKLNEFYQRTQPNLIEFGIGYRWRPNESNLLLATSNPAAPELTSSIAQKAAPRPQEEAAPRQQETVPPQQEAGVVRQPPAYRARPGARAENEPFRGPTAPFPIFPFFLFEQP
jgi:hypothetical protein